MIVEPFVHLKVSYRVSTKNKANCLLPHGAMHKRGLCRRAVSVCPSVTFVDCVETDKHIFNSHTILVFPYQTLWRYSDGHSPNGGVKARLQRHNSTQRRVELSCVGEVSVATPTQLNSTRPACFALIGCTLQLGQLHCRSSATVDLRL